MDLISSNIIVYRSVSRRPDNSQGFITQEEFVIPQQDEEQRQTMINELMSPRVTPLLSDHVHIQHRNLNDNMAYTEQIRQLNDISLNDIGNIYSKTNDEIPSNNITYVQSKNANAHVHIPRQSIRDNFIAARSESEANCMNDKSCSKCIAIGQKRMWDSSSYAQKRRAQEFVNSQKARHDDSFHWRNAINPNKQNSSNQSADYELNKRIQFPNHENYKMHDYLSSRTIGMIEDFKYKFIKNDNLNIFTKLVS